MCYLRMSETTHDDRIVHFHLVSENVAMFVKVPNKARPREIVYPQILVKISPCSFKMFNRQMVQAMAHVESYGPLHGPRVNVRAAFCTTRRTWEGTWMALWRYSMGANMLLLLKSHPDISDWGCATTLWDEFSALWGVRWFMHPWRIDQIVCYSSAVSWDR